MFTVGAGSWPVRESSVAHRAGRKSQGGGADVRHKYKLVAWDYSPFFAPPPLPLAPPAALPPFAPPALGAAPPFFTAPAACTQENHDGS